MDTTKTMKAYLRGAAGVLLGVFLLGITTLNLDSAPPVWWDEGWTLSVARNWILDGHYGRYLLGKPAPRGLEASFPVTASVALSFRLFGVGVFQGRIPGVLFTMGALGLIYYLARGLFNRRIAIATLSLLLFTFWYPDLHPVVMGRQVMGEIPALFFLLTGYAIFFSAQDRPLVTMPLAVFFWGAALITKLQVFPFFLASLSVPLALALATRRWRTVGLLAIGLLGSFATARLLVWLQQILLDSAINGSPMPGLYSITALVGAPQGRFFALFVAIILAIPTVAGLCYGVWNLMKDKRQVVAPDHTDVIKLALLVLAGSWFVWFLVLSNGWFRYLFPATFVGSIFVAAMLYELTDEFSLKWTIGHFVTEAKNRRLSNRRIAAALCFFLIAASVPLTLRMLYQSYVKDADASVMQVVQFLNTETAPDSLIETYDPEIFFLLERPYHYPPDPLHIDLIRRHFFRDTVLIDYSTLATEPDYLVVGLFSRKWQVYDPVLSTGAFRLLKTFDRYDVYERVP